LRLAGPDRSATLTADRNTVAYRLPTRTWSSLSSFPGPVGEGGQFLLRPAAAVPVFLDGVPRILTLGSGHLYTDDTVKPAGTIDPTLNYIFTP
jgi:hypothetical protein